MKTTINSKFWEGYFRTYDILNKISPYQELISKFIYNLNKAHETVLDLGSGTGNFSIAISRENHYNVVSLDSSREGLTLHKKKDPNANTRLHDIRTKLPYNDNSFGNVVSNNTLYLIDPGERQKIVNEVFRILKPGGTFIVSNILKSFNPMRIYWTHIKQLAESIGWLRTLFEMTRYIIPTIKIFYYNSIIKINREHYFEIGEQRALLKHSGFNILRSELVYSDQAEMVIAKKP